MRAALLTPRNRRAIVRSGLSSIRGHVRSLCSVVSGGGSGPGPLANRNNDKVKASVGSDVQDYDVAIVGGGMVGLAVACALSNIPLTKHLKVAVIDSNPALGMSVSLKRSVIPDPRVSAVTPASISFFKELGAWEHIQQQRYSFFDKMQVWDYTGLGYTRYNARDVGKEYLGCVVENRVLHNSLLSCLQSSTDFQNTFYQARLNSMSFKPPAPSAKIELEPSSIKDFPPGKEHLHPKQLLHDKKVAKLDLSDGNSIYAKLVVGADGGKSRVREITGIKTTGWKYSQNAIICTVEHDVENHCAWQRFLPSGPIALLPVGDRFSNIVWTMSPDESSECLSMSHDDFVKAVNDALDSGYGPHPRSTAFDQYIQKFASFTGQGASSVKEDFEPPPKVVTIASERMSFPLSLMHAHAYVSQRVALVGDAAHTVHPLAGQGVNLGFGDAHALSKVIAEGISAGRDIGELYLLRDYETERKAANITMMALLDGFQKAFSVDLGPVNILRAAAFHGAQYIAPLKKNIISYATGEQKWPLFG